MCPHCSHPLHCHLGPPFVISSQGCGLCPCLQPGPALASTKDFDWAAVAKVRAA